MTRGAVPEAATPEVAPPTASEPTGGADDVLVVVPAYQAAETLADVVAGVPAGTCGEILVVDDASRDDTARIARSLPVSLVEHAENRGYGANLKTCYRAALERRARWIVTVHADNQYDPRVIPAALEILRLGICDLVLGNRIRTRREALAGGMPRAKYFANRGLTLIENVLAGQNLGEWHSGFRAVRREVLEAIPFAANSDDFVFDSQVLLQTIHFGFRIGSVPMPVRYFPEASSISLPRAARYAVETLATFGAWQAHRLGLRRSPLFAPPDPAAGRAPPPGAESS